MYTFSLTVWLSDCLENVTDNLECPTNTWNLHSYFTVIVMLEILTNVRVCYWTAPLVNVAVLAMRGSSVFTFSVCLFVCMSMCQVFATPKYGHGGKKKAIERRGGSMGLVSIVNSYMSFWYSNDILGSYHSCSNFSYQKMITTWWILMFWVSKQPSWLKNYHDDSLNNITCNILL